MPPVDWLEVHLRDQGREKAITIFKMRTEIETKIAILRRMRHAAARERAIVMVMLYSFKEGLVIKVGEPRVWDGGVFRISEQDLMI